MVAAQKRASFNPQRRRLVLGALGAALASFAALRGETRSRSDLRRKRPMMGMNLISWDPETNADPRSWQRAVAQIRELGIRRITVVGYRMVDRHTGRIGLRTSNLEPGPSRKVMAAAMATARSLGMDVSLKPLIEIDNPQGEGAVWRGSLDFRDQALGEFFAHYERYVLEMAKLARDAGANRLYIGSELAALTRNESAQRYWHQLIARCRNAYNGNRAQVTYAANFDEYNHVAFWDQLDEIGIDAYFPLALEEEIAQANPRIENLLQSWTKILFRLRKFAEMQDRRILFSEWGVVPLHGTATAPFNWEPSPQGDNAAALDAYQATLMALDTPDNDWLSGVDFWHWSLSPNDQSNYRIEADSDIAQLIRKFSKRGRTPA